jgi:lipopolysaccharide export system permease protein
LRLKPLTLLDRYLFTQLFWVMLFAVIVFSIVWLAPETMFKLTQYFFSGEINFQQFCMMFLYHIPEVLQQTLPVSVMLGSILLFQRLSQSYEVVAFMASGISTRRILAAVLWVGLLFGALHAMVQEWVIPKTSALLESYYTGLNLKDVPDRNFLFVEKNRQSQLSKFFMIGQIQKPQLSDFIILYYTETPEKGVQISRILRSKTGRWLEKDHQWLLLDGIEYVLNQEGVYKEIRKFAEQQIRTDHYASILLDYSRLNPMFMPWGQLKQYIKLLREGGQLQDVPYYEVRLWQKFASPTATVIFALLGALLGIERVRTNSISGLIFGVVIIFFYSILVPFSNNIGSLDLIAPWLVAWLPLTITLVLAALLLSLRPRQG